MKLYWNWFKRRVRVIGLILMIVFLFLSERHSDFLLQNPLRLARLVFPVDRGYESASWMLTSSSRKQTVSYICLCTLHMVCIPIHCVTCTFMVVAHPKIKSFIWEVVVHKTSLLHVDFLFPFPPLHLLLTILHVHTHRQLQGAEAGHVCR